MVSDSAGHTRNERTHPVMLPIHSRVTLIVPRKSDALSRPFVVNHLVTLDV